MKCVAGVVWFVAAVIAAAASVGRAEPPVDPPADPPPVRVYVETKDQRVLLAIESAAIAVRSDLLVGGVPAAQIAGLRRAKGEQFDVKLRNGSEFRAALPDRTLRFKTEGGTSEILTAAIRSIERHEPPPERPRTEPSLWVQTRSGDKVRVGVPAERLTLGTAVAPVSREWKDVETFRVDRGAVVVTTKAGEQLRGAVDLDRFGFTLADSGLKLRNCSKLVRSIIYVPPTLSPRPAPDEQAPDKPAGAIDRGDIELRVETDSEWTALKFPKCGWELVKSEVRSGEGAVALRGEAAEGGKAAVAQVKRGPLVAHVWVRFDKEAKDPTEIVIEKSWRGTTKVSVVYRTESGATQWFENAGGVRGNNPRSFPFHIRPQVGAQVPRPPGSNR